MKLVALIAGAEVPALAQQTQSPADERISLEILTSTLKASGLEFTEAQLKMMLKGVRDNLTAIEALRKINVKPEVSPAFTFSTALPGKPRTRQTGRFLPSRIVAPKKSNDLHYSSVVELGAMLRAKRITSRELTELYIGRLKQHAATLNCVVNFTSDLAMEQATRADAEIRKGKYRGPLHGVPWGAKDLFATTVTPTTWGAENYKSQVFDYNATVVDKLDKAGAVLIAKLSMGALAMGGLWYGGMTKNPWNTEQTSSGSSAGSASATAAGLVGFALGTETLGSITTPSRICGTVGLRPTFGRVSRHGAMALCWTLDKVGPIARYAEDCALVLKAIQGSDGQDLTVIDEPLSWNPRQPLKQLRIGVVQAAFDSARGADPEVSLKALEDLRKAGAELKPVTLPTLDSSFVGLVLGAEAAAAFDDLTRDGGVDKLPGQAANDWPTQFRTNRTIPAVEYIRAQRARTLLMREMEDFMAQWDVIISPGGRLVSVTNLTGHPQLSLPCGFGANGTPRALLLTGRLFEEGKLLRVAHAYQQATKWHKERPKGFA